ncbi:Rib/alpha-like domain-containing protein [Peptoniphilus harei]|uniref:Copper amine oxidase domain protein n=2 Tax=Peptoniphilus TaxID=162289 RepID=A0A943SQW4_9FIRM|nr:Rib/alpha-like domain-containing protein [Peptoniphilus harei]MBS6535222.1 hypothetical protein [Peptoniphilus harei]
MNRKTFSLVTSLAILTSSLSPIWAAGKDFTYNNLNQNLPIKAPVDETKEVEEKIDLPLVTETLPDESIRNKYARIIFVPETKNVDDVMEYGKLLDKEGKEVSLNDISYNDNVVKGKEYYALKSASWREIKNYKENDKQVLYVRKADNNESDPEKKKIHKFLTWKLGARKDFPFFADYKLKFEKYSIDNPVIFQSVFEPLPYFYSISHLENFDADGYKLTNSSDEYYCVEFLSSGGNKDKGVGFRFNDSQIKYACKEANNSKNVVLHIRWNSGDYRFGDYKPQTVNIKDRTFWYWTYDKNSHEIVKDDTKLSISRPTFMAKYIVDYLGVDKDFDLKNNPIPEGCHELKLEVEDGYLFNSVPYEKFAVRDGLSLANISVLENLILKDKNNINYDDDVAWYDRYKKIDNLSEFKINSDTVLTARRVRDYESEKFIPEVKEIEVNKDQDVTLEKLKSGIVNLPKNLDRIEIKTYPDTSEVGEGKATLKLIFTDTSSKEVEVPVKVIEKISGGEITPIPTIKVDDIIKEEVPYHGQINLLDNIKNLPGGAEVKDLSGSIDTKRPGTYTGKVRVTFKDGSSRIVEVPVEVSKSLADSHEAQVKKIEVNKDEDVTLEKLKFGIVNLPKNLDKIEVKTYPDTSEVGEGKAILKLIFTDTSSKEVVIPVKVINIIDAGIVTPVPEIKAEDIIKEEVPYNGEINLLDNIKNLPDGAKVEDISDPIDTKIPGTYKGKIKVIFKDESSRIVEIPVEVSEALADSYTPQVKKIEVNKDELLTREKLESGIVNLPKNLDKIEIKTYPDTSEVGESKVTLKLIFTDTSSKEVEIPVRVIEKISGGIITPIPKINDEDIIKEKVPYNGQINLLDNIKNLPEGADVMDLSDTIDTKSPGTYKGKVKVTFKDGSSRIVEIPIEVLAPMAEEFPVQNPDKTEVENLENINPTEKSEIEEKVREANPQVASIEVDDRGNVTLIYEDGSSNLIKAEDIIILREKTPEEEEPEGIPGEGDKNSEDKPGEVGDKDPEEKQGEKDNKDPEENPKDNEEEDNKKTENKLDSWNDFPRYYVRNHRTPTYKVETKITYKENKPQVNSKKFVIDTKTGTYTVTEDGKTLEKNMEVKPVIKGGRTNLPLRALAEILDAKVIWNEGTRTASFTREGLTALIQIDGKKIVLSNGETIELESKALNINGRIYLPLVNVGQVFGLTSGNSLDGEDQDIEWDDKDKTVTINIK